MIEVFRQGKLIKILYFSPKVTGDIRFTGFTSLPFTWLFTLKIDTRSFSSPKVTSKTLLEENQLLPVLCKSDLEYVATCTGWKRALDSLKLELYEVESCPTYQELNLGPLQDHCTLLTAKPSF